VRADSGIRTPLELIGKRTELSESAEILAMLHKEGIDSKKISIQPRNIDIHLDDLINGKTDAYFGYLTNEAYQLKIKGVKYRSINPRDYGVNFYNDILITSERLIRDNPNEVDAFRRASLRGWEYALAHIDETVRFIHQHYATGKSLGQLDFEAHELYKLIMPDMVQVGHMNPERWRRIGESYAELGMMKPQFDLNGFLYDTNPPPKDLTWLYWSLIGALAAIVVVAAALWQVHRINGKLKKSSSLQQATLESSRDGVLVVDLNNTWALYNQRFIDLWQIPDEIIATGGKDALIYLMNQLEDADGFLKRVRELYATPESTSLDILKFKDGKVIERYSMPQYIDGKAAGRVWSFRDITELKRTEVNLRQAKETAEAATKLKDQFVSLISHDLRSPLLSIKGMLDVAKAESPEGLLEMGKNHTFERIAKSAKGLIALIERLLDHSRMQTGDIKPQMRFINLRWLVEDQINRIEHLAAVKNIPILNNLPEEMYIYADPDLYGEVIQNILSNAIKFTPHGGEITILSEDESSVIVRDNGIGIDEKMLDDLFKSNVKTSTRGTAGEIGTGLGLPYSANIMKAHGGSLTAVPMKGAGAEFHIILPKHTVIVLIVDDQDIQRAIIKEMFAKLKDVQVVEASNGAEALEILKHVTPAIIISDVQMPVMDGFELVRQIRCLPQYEMVPIVAVTSFAGIDYEEAREKLLSLGADDVFAKPLAEDEFLPMVARYTGQSSRAETTV
jgi:signal transduction histidine kinase